MVPARRVAAVTAVTAGLVVAGAVFGAVAGVVALAAGLLITDHEIWGFWLAGPIGALFGAITAPLLGWGVMRRVPLGKMFVWSAIGTAVGGVVGWILNPLLGLIGAVAGCGIACHRLRQGDPSGDNA